MIFVRLNDDHKAFFLKKKISETWTQDRWRHFFKPIILADKKRRFFLGQYEIPFLRNMMALFPFFLLAPVLGIYFSLAGVVVAGMVSGFVWMYLFLACRHHNARKLNPNLGLFFMPLLEKIGQLNLKGSPHFSLDLTPDPVPLTTPKLIDRSEREMQRDNIWLQGRIPLEQGAELRISVRDERQTRLKHLPMKRIVRGFRPYNIRKSLDLRRQINVTGIFPSHNYQPVPGSNRSFEKGETYRIEDQLNLDLGKLGEQATVDQGWEFVSRIIAAFRMRESAQ